jgi:hypothetical protein
MKRDNSYLLGNQFAKGNAPNQTAFAPGHETWNKGVKGLHLSPQSEFKKGRANERKLSVGTTTVRYRRRDKKPRRFIKISEQGGWTMFAKYLWEQHYGSLRAGDVVHHLNGNQLDDRIENLIALPRTDHPVFHGRWGIKPLTEEQIAFYKARYK